MTPVLWHPAAEAFNKTREIAPPITKIANAGDRAARLNQTPTGDQAPLGPRPATARA